MRNPDAVVALIAAIRSPDENALLRAAQGVDTDAYDADGKTPLIHAAACGNAVAVDFLLHHGADPLRVSREFTESPFVLGIRRRDRVITRLLLDAGRLAAQSIRRAHELDCDLSLSVDPDIAHLVRRLRQGCDPNTFAFGQPGLTLLGRFLRKRDALAVSTVIQWGCDVSQILDTGWGELPPLHVAAAEGLADIVWLLLLDGANPNRLEQGRSALFLSAEVPSPEIAELLLDAGATVDVGWGKETPLMRASAEGYIDTVQLFVTLGSDLNRTDSSGCTALHYAAESGHHPVVKFLLDAGADPWQRDTSGYTAADAASNAIDPIFTQLYREWGMPDRYSLEPMDDDWEPSGDFSYFLSYRHGRFAAIAADLANQMNRLGLRTFTDQMELRIGESETLTRSCLKSRLLKAIRCSRTLIFFESYLDGSSRPEDGLHAFNWQFFELLHAREALFVSIDRRVCQRWILTPGKRVELSDVLFTFSEIPELSKRLAWRDWEV